jgi:hypothetical protein
MSVAEIKSQAGTMSPVEIDELSRFFRGLALKGNRQWKADVASGLKNPRWVERTAMDQAIDKLEKNRE